MLRAARAHAITSEEQLGVIWSADQSERWDMTDSDKHAWKVGDPTTVYTTKWNSDVTYDGSAEGGDAAAWEGWDVQAWGLDGGGPLRKVELGPDPDPNPSPNPNPNPNPYLSPSPSPSPSRGPNLNPNPNPNPNPNSNPDR